MPDGSNPTMPMILDRTFTLERATGEGGRPSYRASLSSELPVERFFGTEILVHNGDAVNMTRAGRGLSLLFNHDVDKLLGRVASIRLEGARLVGDLTFSDNSELAKQYAAEVADGFAGDVSIRYSIDEYTTTTDERGHDTITVTRWTPLEVSIVTVPADHTVGVGRSHTAKEAHNVTTKTTATGGEEGDGGNVNVVKFKDAHERGMQEGMRKAAEAERARIEEIDGLFAACRFKGAAYDALRAECVKNGSNVEQARRALFDLVNGDTTAPVAEPTGTRSQPDQVRATRQPFVQAGEAEADKLAVGIQRSIELRAGMLSGDEAAKEAGNEFRGRTLVDLMRAWADKSGIRVQGGSPYQVIGQIIHEGRRLAAHGTTDFTGIVANVASKSLLAGWEENPSTWGQWCRKGTLNDFRRANRTGLSGASLLDAVAEHGEYTHGTMSDRTEYITAVKYGKLFSISREAILADDLGAFTATPRKMGRAADLTINKAVYDYLVGSNGAGPTMNQDSIALFDVSTHGNYVTSSGGAPSVARFEVGRNALATRTDPNNGLPLNIQPKYWLGPSALVTTAKVLVASEKDPLGTTSATGGATTPNPFYNALTVIGEPYLDGLTSGSRKGNIAWYLIADQNLHDTVEVAFVGGQQSPYLESRDGWTVDGVEYKVRIEAGVAALDWRAMFRNDGD